MNGLLGKKEKEEEEEEERKKIRTNRKASPHFAEKPKKVKRKKKPKDYNSCFGCTAEPAKKNLTKTIAGSAKLPNQLKIFCIKKNKK